MGLRLGRRFRAVKVPEVDLRFWYIKLLTTAMGESTSDFAVHRFNPELAVLVGAAVFAGVLWLQLRSPRYLVAPYWSAVVMVSVFGTMCADVVHVALGVPYVISTATFAVTLGLVFSLWYRVERTLSIHTIDTTRRELFYWAAITTTFALGTAAGDYAAYVVGLGYRDAAVLFLVLFVAPGLYFGLARRHPVATFWSAYVLTRPLGASVADWVGVSHARGGLNAGPGTLALALTGLIAVGVARGAHVQRRTVHP